jgi:hypothetical protein
LHNSGNSIVLSILAIDLGVSKAIVPPFIKAEDIGANVKTLRKLSVILKPLKIKQFNKKKRSIYKNVRIRFS